MPHNLFRLLPISNSLFFPPTLFSSGSSLHLIFGWGNLWGMENEEEKIGVICVFGWEGGRGGLILVRPRCFLFGPTIWGDFGVSLNWRENGRERGGLARNLSICPSPPFHVRSLLSFLFLLLLLFWVNYSNYLGLG